MNKMLEYFNGLEDRERYFLLAGAVFLIGFVFFNFIISPVINYKKGLESKISSYRFQAQEISKLGEEYRKLTGKNSSYKVSDQNDIALFSFLDSLAGKVNIKNNIDYMKPSGETKDGYTIEKVEIKISEIDMKTLVSFLYEVESYSDKINITALKIIKSDKGGSISSTIQAETVKSNG